MTESIEKLSLKWNNFQQFVATTYSELRENADFSDVTLVCEDGVQVDAHKVILSACSPFFNNILQKCKLQNTLIYMRGVKGKCLLAIVDFIYHGAVNLYQEDLADFLSIAEELRLKGLVVEEYYKGPVEETVFENVIVENSPTKEGSSYKLLELKAENTYFIKGKIMKSNNLNTSILSTDILDELDQQINSMMQKLGADKDWSCASCGKTFGHKSALRRHIEANHIEGISHPCNKCNKVSRTRHSLIDHNTRYHKKS